MKKRYQKGSYTVETALLMGIVLSVLILVILTGFYFHDRGMMQGAAHEAACGYVLHQEDDKGDKNLTDKLIRGNMLWTKGVKADVDGGKKKVTVRYQGGFSIPSMAAAYFGKGELNLTSQVTLTVQKPTLLIQKIRGAAKIVDRVRGE